jgi:hypothetical protein
MRLEIIAMANLPFERVVGGVHVGERQLVPAAGVADPLQIPGHF